MIDQKKLLELGLRFGPLTGMYGFFAFMVLAFTGYRYYWVSAEEVPPQPVGYKHRLHVVDEKGPKLLCIQCHQYTDKGRQAGAPPLLASEKWNDPYRDIGQAAYEQAYANAQQEAYDKAFAQAQKEVYDRTFAKAKADGRWETDCVELAKAAQEKSSSASVELAKTVRKNSKINSIASAGVARRLAMKGARTENRGPVACADCHGPADPGDEAYADAGSTNAIIAKWNSIKKGKSPEFQKVVDHIQNKEPIDWHRVHKMPTHVYFSHKRHIKVFGEFSELTDLYSSVYDETYEKNYKKKHEELIKKYSKVKDKNHEDAEKEARMFALREAENAASREKLSATCAYCHGEVRMMGENRQVRSLEMGFCISCHKSKDAPTDCYTCHK